MNRALRRSAPLALAAASALVLVGCSGTPDEPEATEAPDAAACMDVPAGDLSDAVEVGGEFGQTVTAKFDTPVEGADLQRTVAIEGDGEVTAAGDSVDVVLSLYSGVSGEQLVSSPGTLAVGDETLLGGFVAAIDCVAVGSRTVTVAPASSLYGETGNESLGIGPDESLVIVADITDFYEEPALPTPSEWTENVPEVKFNGDKTPDVTMPDAAPSPDLQLVVFEEGDGAEVAQGDSVTLQYKGINYDTGETFDESYARGEAATFTTDQVIPGFGAALVGQKVGSKLAVSIPPALGYGAEPSETNELAGHTLVFVIEIEDAGPAA